MSIHADLNLSLVIRIVRDVVNRTGIRTLSGVWYDQKEDASKVTDIDPLIECIVREHLDAILKGEKNEVCYVAEETAHDIPTSNVKAMSCRFLVTVDGIDGTGDFLRHFNEAAPNPKWLLGLTAVYERNKEHNTFSPLLSFAYQYTEDRIVALIGGKPLMIENPLGKARVVPLSQISGDSRPLGSADVYLEPKTKDREYEIDQALVKQSGPSGYNMFSLAVCCAPTSPPVGTLFVNFTTFHYTLWDFGLWAVLHACGFVTISHATGEVQSEIDASWFSGNQKTKHGISDPLVICSQAHQSEIRSKLKRLPSQPIDAVQKS